MSSHCMSSRCCSTPSSATSPRPSPAACAPCSPSQSTTYRQHQTPGCPPPTSRRPRRRWRPHRLLRHRARLRLCHPHLHRRPGGSRCPGHQSRLLRLWRRNHRLRATAPVATLSATTPVPHTLVRTTSPPVTSPSRRHRPFRSCHCLHHHHLLDHPRRSTTRSSLRRRRRRHRYRLLHRHSWSSSPLCQP